MRLLLVNIKVSIKLPLSTAHLPTDEVEKELLLLPRLSSHCQQQHLHTFMHIKCATKAISAALK